MLTLERICHASSSSCTFWPKKIFKFYKMFTLEKICHTSSSSWKFWHKLEKRHLQTFKTHLFSDNQLFHGDTDTVESETSHSDDSSGNIDKETNLTIAHLPDNVAKITTFREQGSRVSSVRVHGGRGYDWCKVGSGVRVCCSFRVNGDVSPHKKQTVFEPSKTKIL